MTATLQDSQKEKESDSDTNNVDSVTTILTAKKMMSATVVKGPWKMIKIEVKRRVGRPSQHSRRRDASHRISEAYKCI